MLKENTLWFSGTNSQAALAGQCGHLFMDFESQAENGWNRFILQGALDRDGASVPSVQQPRAAQALPFCSHFSGVPEIL